MAGVIAFVKGKRWLAAVAENADTGERTVFSSRFACPVSGFTIEEIEPRLFSFNNPYGACPACDGLGTELFFEPDLVVPDDCWVAAPRPGPLHSGVPWVSMASASAPTTG